MLTRWGRALDPEHVLQEYPRPQLVRDSYLNLNGHWDYAITGPGQAPRQYDGTILVPFSPEAPLSGVGRQLLPDDVLWYHRRFDAPPLDEGHRLLLHFGAVDQDATVYVNGVEVGRNHGGYLPFTCDVTDAVEGADNALVVRVTDVSGNRGPSSGKQQLRRGGIWYTAQSGIWQTVWAEVVPDQHVQGLELVPLLEEDALQVTVRAPRAGTATVRILAAGAEVATAEVETGHPARIPLPDAHRWTPEDPFLHDVEVTLGQDGVRSYVGMRSFGVGPDAYGVPRLLLNGEPYLHVGVLDQGYWPDGLMTPPSDEAIVHDITTMRALGFNVLRKHVKVEPLRWYHHCDRLGMLVWQDFVNGGERYLDPVISWPGRMRGRWIKLDDRHHRLFGRADPQHRKAFGDEARRTVELLRSTVSVAVWVPFNEAWGQFDAARFTDEVRALDPTRPVDHASGWHDQGAGDVRSVHVYRRAFRMPRRRDRRAVALTEYGGHDLAVTGHTWGRRPFGYGHHENAEELLEAFVGLHEQLASAVAAGLSATVYTQLSDVEDEVNGLLTYDREVLKLPARAVRRALEALRRPPYRPCPPGENGDVPTEGA
jgi:hypothetical protein